MSVQEQTIIKRAGAFTDGVKAILRQAGQLRKATKPEDIMYQLVRRPDTSKLIENHAKNVVDSMSRPAPWSETLSSALKRLPAQKVDRIRSHFSGFHVGRDLPIQQRLSKMLRYEKEALDQPQRMAIAKEEAGDRFKNTAQWLMGGAQVTEPQLYLAALSKMRRKAMPFDLRPGPSTLFRGQSYTAARQDHGNALLWHTQIPDVALVYTDRGPYVTRYDFPQKYAQALAKRSFPHTGAPVLTKADRDFLHNWYAQPDDKAQRELFDSTRGKLNTGLVDALDRHYRNLDAYPDLLDSPINNPSNNLYGQFGLSEFKGYETPLRTGVIGWLLRHGGTSRVLYAPKGVGKELPGMVKHKPEPAETILDWGKYPVYAYDDVSTPAMLQSLFGLREEILRNLRKGSKSWPDTASRPNIDRRAAAGLLATASSGRVNDMWKMIKKRFDIQD